MIARYQPSRRLPTGRVPAPKPRSRLNRPHAVVSAGNGETMRCRSCDWLGPLSEGVRHAVAAQWTEQPEPEARS